MADCVEATFSPYSVMRGIHADDVFGEAENPFRFFVLCHDGSKIRHSLAIFLGVGNGSERIWTTIILRYGYDIIPFVGVCVDSHDDFDCLTLVKLVRDSTVISWLIHRIQTSRLSWWNMMNNSNNLWVAADRADYRLGFLGSNPNSNYKRPRASSTNVLYKRPVLYEQPHQTCLPRFHFYNTIDTMFSRFIKEKLFCGAEQRQATGPFAYLYQHDGMD